MTSPLADGLSAVPDRLEELASQDLFSGVVHVVRGDLAQGGEVLLSTAHGRASRRWEVPVRTSTRFDVASVTKLFTAVAVLQQVGLGRLGLDESIHSYVDLAGTTISPAVTLRHLLTHTSGIGDDADEEAGESYEALWVDKPVYAVTETADFLPQFVHKEPNFAPGEGCRYCNVGYVLLGLALERVTGRTYRDVVRTDVFARSGMDRSGFFDRRDSEPDVAEGWEPVRADPEDEADPEGSVIVSWRQNIFSYPPIGSPDGGAHCTAADLVRFLTAVRRGELLPPELTAGFLTPQVLHHAVSEPEPGPGATTEVHHAWGLEVEVTAQGSVRSIYKDGINTGSSAILRYYPAQDVTLAVVASSEDAAWGPISLLDEIVTTSPAS
ncbi:beta-lactamase family protein [Actinotalea sp. BY-33]|uniref:Beta-lactamase family protein n=1 Tax=Actinotalea soli TaxID=2819234 RepID=A0A939LY19_9CELL|nr:serine hydrolase domain-containing protein [Actinotalea soli]MBO1753347.1 beta-lactamase family protein [Actinotalea soli]